MVTLSCIKKGVGAHDCEHEISVVCKDAYCPLGKAEDVSSVGSPLSFDEALGASFYASAPGFIAHLKDVDDASARRSSEDIFRVTRPTNMRDVNRGRHRRARDRRTRLSGRQGRGGVGIKEPRAGDLEGISPTNDETVSNGGEQEMSARAESNEGRRVFVNLSKVHHKMDAPLPSDGDSAARMWRIERFDRRERQNFGTKSGQRSSTPVTTAKPPSAAVAFSLTGFRLG